MNNVKNVVCNAILAIVAIIAIVITAGSFHFNVKDRDVLVFQFGKVINVKNEPGVYWTIPLIQNTKSIFVGERIYDIPTTNVTTSDKKSMICNAYVTWKITDTKLYYQQLSSVETAQGRLDTAVYAAMKNVISSNNQDRVISGKDGSLGETILKKINLSQYGIEVTDVEIKVLDLPDDNKSAVYDRMISERNAIAAQYTADGEKEANTAKSKTDAEVRQIKSDAEAQAAATIAEGEAEYYRILADAYSKSPDKTEFYMYWTGINALEDTLKNGGTFVIDESSPLYDILMNKADTTSSSVYANSENEDNDHE